MTLRLRLESIYLMLKERKVQFFLLILFFYYVSEIINPLLRDFDAYYGI